MNPVPATFGTSVAAFQALLSVDRYLQISTFHRLCDGSFLEQFRNTVRAEYAVLTALILAVEHPRTCVSDKTRACLVFHALKVAAGPEVSS